MNKLNESDAQTTLEEVVLALYEVIILHSEDTSFQGDFFETGDERKSQILYHLWKQIGDKEHAQIAEDFVLKFIGEVNIPF
ncbi:hypothetical protein ACOI22_10665 [Glaciecola sp. 2405UD65-10]|uniref:hypothetical protein n=1 Tax=Glaciecola sp. 2405UD65-10 TaxID=3397244 RepID=UPI003B598648